MCKLNRQYIILKLGVLINRGPLDPNRLGDSLVAIQGKLLMVHSF
jgi:hypothetical protein